MLKSSHMDYILLWHIYVAFMLFFDTALKITNFVFNVNHTKH